MNNNVVLYRVTHSVIKGRGSDGTGLGRDGTLEESGERQETCCQSLLKAFNCNVCGLP